MILARLLSCTLSQRDGNPTSAERFLELGEGDEEDDRPHDDVDEPARDENEENRIVPRRREEGVAGSGVSRDTPEPNMRPHDTRK
jgi:hypothetical protein